MQINLKFWLISGSIVVVIAVFVGVIAGLNARNSSVNNNVTGAQVRPYQNELDELERLESRKQLQFEAALKLRPRGIE